MNNPTDKEIEKKRYNVIAKKRLRYIDQNDALEDFFGSSSIKNTLRDPYECYERYIKEMVRSSSKALEIGAGEGRFSRIILEHAESLTALDISPISNQVNQTLNKQYANLKVVEGDIESLPFDNESFNFVMNAGSLSYGSKSLVKDEILRVLKPGGYFICVDSLNNSFIYRLNRYLRYIKNDRSKSTLLNMWNLNDIKNFEKNFDSFKLFTFGSLSFLEPVLVLLVGDQKFIRLSRYLDSKQFLKRYAFKFVFIGQKKL